MHFYGEQYIGRTEDMLMSFCYIHDISRAYITVNGRNKKAPGFLRRLWEDGF